MQKRESNIENSYYFERSEKMNEEPIAVYEAKLSEEEFLQGARFLLRKSPMLRNVRVFGYILLVLAGLFFLFHAFALEEIPGRRPVVHVYVPYIFGAIFMVLLDVGFFFVTRWAVTRAAKNAYAQQKMSVPENAKRQTLFFRDRLEIRQDGVTLTYVPYGKATGAWYNGSLCLVLLSYQTLGIYRADGFSQGTFEAVLQAMESQVGRKLLKNSKAKNK